MRPTDPDEALAAAARASTGQLLLRAARLLDERALAALAATPGAPPLRPAHTRLFPHLDFRGVRPSVLAERLGVTKQAITPLIGELAAWGVVELIDDPTDARARLVRFAPSGLEGLQRGLAALGAFEAAVVAEVGPERAAIFREVLEVWERQLAAAAPVTAAP